jgi:hypothetical protein
MLAEFQQALADLTASPDLCIEARRNPDLLRERYKITDREARRLQGVVNHPAMECNCMLYRANRLAPLALNLPNLVKALGTDLRGVLDDFWKRYPNTDVHFYIESYRFCEFVGEEISRGRDLPAAVVPSLHSDMKILAERLEISHTELYSPLAKRRNSRQLP